MTQVTQGDTEVTQGDTVTDLHVIILVIADMIILMPLFICSVICCLCSNTVATGAVWCTHGIHPTSHGYCAPVENQVHDGSISALVSNTLLSPGIPQFFFRTTSKKSELYKVDDMHFIHQINRLTTTKVDSTYLG